MSDRAYRFLARREYSVWELREKIARDQPDQLVDALIDELIELGHLSDRRFAEQLCRSRFRGGKGPVKIRHELANHRVGDEIIEAVLADYAGEWSALAREVRAKKFGEQSPESWEEWARQARFLTQRGFAPDQIEPFDK